MDNQLAARVSRIKISPTMAVSALAARLRAEGRDVIGLGAGEPDFDTPDHIKEAAIAAVRDGQTKYTAVDGTAELKKAICDKFQRDNTITYEPNQILVSSGAKQSLFNVCQAVLDDGDEMIIPAPYWVSYPDMALLTGGVPVYVNAGSDQHFKITAAQLEAAITPRSRILMLNSPSNPTGVAYSRDELKALAGVLLKYPRIIIVSDDIYEHILFAGGEFSNIVNVCPELFDQTIVVNGVSKAYAMTGWRIGYAGGPKYLIDAMKKVQSQSTSNPCSVSQAAALVALNGDQTCREPMLAAFEERHQYIVAALNEVRGFECLSCDGAFYCFPRVQAAIDNIADVSNDVEFSSYVLDKAGVAIVPGSAFGLEGYVRISFATSMENLHSAVERIGKLMAN